MKSDMAIGNRRNKILILTINHPWYDSRVFFRVVKSLLKKDVFIHLITACSINSVENISEDNFNFEIIAGKSMFSLFWHFIRKGIAIKPNIVICIEPLSLISGLILKMILKCRMVYDCHEYYSDAFEEKIKGFATPYWAFESFFARRADSIITVNDILVEKYKSINNQVYLCANLPNINIFNNEDSKKTYDLIYSGQLSFERGLKVYLNTAKLFKDNNQDFKLLIIGAFTKHSTKKFFIDYIKNHQLEDYIIYKSYLPINEVLKYIKNSKIGIFMGDKKLSPRYNKAISMKILEFLSQTVPVVVNKLDMLEDFIDKSQGGWVVGFDNQELYDLLCKVLNDEQLLKKKGQNGYEYLKENMVWENQECELYKGVFGESSISPPILRG